MKFLRSFIIISVVIGLCLAAVNAAPAKAPTPPAAGPAPAVAPAATEKPAAPAPPAPPAAPKTDAPLPGKGIPFVGMVQTAEKAIGGFFGM